MGAEVLSDITVVVPTVAEREGPYRDATLESVRAQTLRPELLVVLDDMGAGPWGTRNLGLQSVVTPWTAFLDDDDWMLPHHLQTLMDASEDADLIYPRPWVLDATGPFGNAWEPWGTDQDFDPERLRHHNFIPITYLVRTEVAQAVGGFPPRSPGAPSDWQYLLKLLGAGCRFAHVPERTWVWRRHRSNAYSWRTPMVDNASAPL
jgi:glycosyltransferase involved in cell wall biosynthesis